MFSQKGRAAKIICETGIIIFAMVYFGNDPDSSTYLRYLMYMKMDSSSRTIKPESLPPI